MPGTQVFLFAVPMSGILRFDYKRCNTLQQVGAFADEVDIDCTLNHEQPYRIAIEKATQSCITSILLRPPSLGLEHLQHVPNALLLLNQIDGSKKRLHLGGVIRKHMNGLFWLIGICCSSGYTGRVLAGDVDWSTIVHNSATPMTHDRNARTPVLPLPCARTDNDTFTTSFLRLQRKNMRFGDISDIYPGAPAQDNQFAGFLSS